MGRIGLADVQQITAAERDRFLGPAAVAVAQHDRPVDSLHATAKALSSDEESMAPVGEADGIEARTGVRHIAGLIELRQLGETPLIPSAMAGKRVCPAKGA